MVNDEILDSWKDISNYLGKDIKTCHRWEKKHGLPIHRIDKSSTRSKVFAYKAEIDDWLRNRSTVRNNFQKSFIKNKSFVLVFIALIVILSGFVAVLSVNLNKNSLLQSKSIPILVFPFENGNTSAENEYFSAGLTQEIANHLSLQDNLNVIQAGSLPQFKIEDKKWLQTQCKEFGVKYLLRGNVEQIEDQFRLNLFLSEAKKDSFIWNDVFQSSLDDIASLKNTVCTKIYENLKLKKEERQFYPSMNTDINNHYAFDSYLKGNFILNKLDQNSDDKWGLYFQGRYYSNLSSKEGNELAIRLFSRAIDLDSNFSKAHYGLANCYTNYLNFRWDDDYNWLDSAEKLVMKANSLSPDLPEYYSTLSKIKILKYLCLNEESLEMGFELAKEGEKKYPHNYEINCKVAFCYYLNFGKSGNESDFQEALEHMKKSYWINPFSISNLFLTELLLLNNEFDEALKITKQIKAFCPSQLVDSRLGEICYYMGRLDESLEIFQRPLKELKKNLYNLIYVGLIYAQKGEKKGAIGITKEMIDIYSGELTIPQINYLLASIFFGVGEEELGSKYLSLFFNHPETYKEKYIYHKYIDLDKNFSKYRENQPFLNILKGEKKWQKADL